MEIKKSKNAQIENQRGTWFLMGFITVLASLFIAFEWAQHDVKINTDLGVNDPVFEELVIPLTFPEVKLPPPPKPAMTDVINIIEDNSLIDENAKVDTEETGAGVEPIVIPPPVIEEVLPVEAEIVDFAEVMPAFPGDAKELHSFLAKNIKYHPVPQEQGISGKVIVQFVVDKDGSITNPVVVRGVDPYLDKEALRVVNMMPKWSPGKQGHRTVRVKYTLPITFRLQ